MSTEHSVTYPRCTCGGILSFPTGLPVFVSFDGGDIHVNVDMGEVSDIDQELSCADCDDPGVSEEAYDRMKTLLIYTAERMRLYEVLRMPTDGEIARRTAFDGKPIEVIG